MDYKQYLAGAVKNNILVMSFTGCLNDILVHYACMILSRFQYKTIKNIFSGLDLKLFLFEKGPHLTSNKNVSILNPPNGTALCSNCALQSKL